MKAGTLSASDVRGFEAELERTKRRARASTSLARGMTRRRRATILLDAFRIADVAIDALKGATSRSARRLRAEFLAFRRDQVAPLTALRAPALPVPGRHPNVAREFAAVEDLYKDLILRFPTIREATESTVIRDEGTRAAILSCIRDVVEALRDLDDRLLVGMGDLRLAYTGRSSLVLREELTPRRRTRR